MRRTLQIVGWAGFWLAALFGGAGSFDWPRGWIYAAVYFGGMAIAGVAVYRANPTLFAARANWRHSDTKPFDKIFLAVFLPMTYLQPAVAGMDAVRFGWTSMPFAAVYPGVALLAAGIAMVTWAMRVNQFAETSVRIQTDRGHTVITTGPYRFVRHPMYVGAILLYAATPLLLGSLWAAALSGVIVILFLIRTALEDRTLQRELPGYRDYAARTRYRLLPGVW